MDAFLDKFLKKTIWMWLPFYALVVLTKDLIAHLDKDDGK